MQHGGAVKAPTLLVVPVFTLASLSFVVLYRGPLPPLIDDCPPPRLLFRWLPFHSL